MQIRAKCGPKLENLSCQYEAKCKKNLRTETRSIIAIKNVNMRLITYVYFVVNPVIFLNICNFKQDRQCMYNVTMRRVRVTIFAVKKQKI